MSETNTTKRRKFSVDALFTDTTPRAVGVSDLVDAKLIRRDRIEPDPDQPRQFFDEDALQDLATSIRAEGILQPIAVRYDEPRDIYVIIHGERRWRAAGIAGLESLPAVVRDIPEDRRLIQQLVENIVREDLNALDRAAALRVLKQQMGDPSWDAVAEAVGIRRSRLFQLLGTEKLEERVQEALRRGMISEKQTRLLQGLPEDIQRDLGVAILEGQVPPKSFDDYVRNLRGGRSATPKTARPASLSGLPPKVERVRSSALALNNALGDLDLSTISSLEEKTAEQLLTALRVLDERLQSSINAIEDLTK
ncbi:MAG: ParB/RepB/Spo0J family partition protein [Chloroflexota bacterium]|nr:ParB/RepB/Spo0J family partition protein [Chloroflexota bacterium]